MTSHSLKLDRVKRHVLGRLFWIAGEIAKHAKKEPKGDSPTQALHHMKWVAKDSALQAYQLAYRNVWKELANGAEHKPQWQDLLKSNLVTRKDELAKHIDAQRSALGDSGFIDLRTMCERNQGALNELEALLSWISDMEGGK